MLDFVDLTMQKVLLTSIAFSLTVGLYGQSQDFKLQVEEKFGLTIKTDSGFVDTWNKISYHELTDDTNLSDYFNLLLTEYSKYPEGYFDLIGIDTVVVCKKLRFKSQTLAAVPDPYRKTLLLDANYSRYKKGYLIQVMHHELHHCTEYAIWKDMYYSWSKWSDLNMEGFRYGSGGASAYLAENATKDYYTMCHPKEGFANPYQMTGEEEDRCEIMGFILSDHRRGKLIEYCKEDKIILAKVRLLIDLMDTFVGTKDNYWHRQLEKEIGW